MTRYGQTAPVPQAEAKKGYALAKKMPTQHSM
jgi:hypothetical protein